MKTISKLASEFGLKTDTIRYYERIGLLPEPTRTPANYRLYDQSAAERLGFIKSGQRLGLRLDEIKELLEIRDTGLCPCGHTSSLLRKRIADIDDELTRLSALRAELAGMIQDWPDNTAGEGSPRWHCAGELIPVGATLGEWLCPEPGNCEPSMKSDVANSKEVNYG